jgi:formyltetrahydrofolate synthetase
VDLLKQREPRGRRILVTAITPTSLGGCALLP